MYGHFINIFIGTFFYEKAIQSDFYREMIRESLKLS